MKRTREPVQLDSRKRQCTLNNIPLVYGNSPNLLEILDNKVKKYDAELAAANAEIAQLKKQIMELTQRMKQVYARLGCTSTNNCSYIS